MELVISPGAALRGTYNLPGDKSISHRAALFAALAEGESHIENFLVAGVTERMLHALTGLRVPWQLIGDSLTVQSPGLHGLAAHREALLRGQLPPLLDCGNSATTLRLLAGAVAATRLPAVLDGSAGLRRRPMDRIVQPLQEMGVPVSAIDGKFAPLTIASGVSSRPYHSLHYRLPVASAQVKSCLLLAGLAADGPTTLVEPGPSRDHTERMLRSMGVEVATVSLGGPVEVMLYPLAGRTLSPLRLTCPGDISAAAFLIVAALISPGSEVLLPGIGLNPTRTGILDALLAMGAKIDILNMGEQAGEPVGDLRVRHSALKGTSVSGDLVVRMIDEFPVFAVAAAYATGSTQVSEAEELRYKESDRITALVEQLINVGVQIEARPDGFVLPGSTPPTGGEVYPNGDHRIAMSLAVAGLAGRSPVTVHQAEIVHESFPDFSGALAQLGAQAVTSAQGE